MSNNSGLSSAEVISRQKSGLVNKYKQPSTRSYFEIIQDNVLNFINIVLIIISMYLVVVGQPSDAVVYIAVALFNSLIGLAQEVYSKIKLDKISLLNTAKNTVIREGKEISIFPSEIVIDDLVVLKAGDICPVDGTVVTGQGELDESALTGESERVSKNPKDKVFSASFLVTGQLCIVAEAVGASSMANKITDKAKAHRRTFTPIQKEINLTIRILFSLAIILATFIFVSALFQDMVASERVQIMAVIFGLIPNSLFAMVNLSYALGGLKILRKGALIQRLNSVESLSNVDTLCLDKTGTLTTKQLVLEQIIPTKIDEKKLSSILGSFVASQTSGNVTTEAIAKKYLGKKQKVEFEVDFGSDHKWSGLGISGEFYVLGAPEIVLGDKIETELTEKIDSFTDQGMRVLIFARAGGSFEFKKTKSPSLPKKLEILGILVFSDQIRQEAKNTIEKFVEAGVEIKIISGDNPSTVSALARQVSIQGSEKVISGIELETMTEFEFTEQVLEKTIFGRITPEQKERIVKILKNEGRYVAMIGDGVNDILSLKQANLAISMESGSPATRNIADIILLKDSFAALPKGLIEGQKIRSSLYNIFCIFLTRITFLALIIVGVSLVRIPFPFTIKQTSLIALLTTGIPALGLAFWSIPQSFGKQKLIPTALKFVVPASFLLLLFGMTLYTTYIYFDFQRIAEFGLDFKQNQLVAKNRTILSIFLILSGLLVPIFVLHSNSIKKSTINIRYQAILSAVILGIFGIIYLITPVRRFWDLTQLNIYQWATVISLTVFWAILLQLFLHFRILDRFLGNRTLKVASE